ncbi:glycosyltransferase family 4 protein [Rhodocytophaga aerolata]|uniref:Glycosyltransferase family 4 protein n=1 Tax=Rhodocytophaga aerolata TaxID=455078 RepID=A0ABT8REM5_9BACT|nr:glycosyltransferase family 4 protein [Rhodocytophaga aerolata]MDO1449799.1 glycosyltransferase family 4 protein [Rhodocytophaga aerolata]
MKKLAIITTHPIQYYAPLFRILSQSSKLCIKVFYTWNISATGTQDPGFGKLIEWDIPLLDGYNYTFVTNISNKPGSHHFRGIVNPTLNDEIKDWGANALLVFGWNYQSHLQAIRYFKGLIPIYFRGDSHLLDEKFGIKTFARRMFLRWVYSHIDIAFYVGQNNKQYYLAHGLSDDQLKYTPHAIDNKRFSNTSFEYSNQALIWRKSLGIELSDTVFLFAGKLEPKKNPNLLLESFIGLKEQNIHLIFVGNGILERSLKKQSKPYNNIHFLDFQNQTIMPIVYRLGNVFVLPSQGPGETWGLAVNEAMACSIPVLISDKVGCAVDLVKPGCNGYVFKSGNHNDLMNKMRTFIHSKDKLNEMSKHSAQIIKHWSYENISNNIVQQLG